MANVSPTLLFSTSSIKANHHFHIKELNLQSPGAQWKGNLHRAQGRIHSSAVCNRQKHLYISLNQLMLAGLPQFSFKGS